jgi:hypothetical protein
MRCKGCPTDAWIDASVSFSLDDAFCRCKQVQDQIIVGMLVWITGSIARLEQKVDRLDTAVDGLTKAVGDLTVDVGNLVRW